MSNTLLTSSVIAKESLRLFKNALGFTRGANRQYSDEFANKGAKVGSVINIRLPQRFTVSDGASVNLQDVTNATTALTLNSRKHVAFQFSTQELTLSIDKFAETYLGPAAVALANKVDVDGLAQALGIANAVGTPGTSLSAIDTAIDAGVKLDNMGCPQGTRTLILNPKNQAGVVKGSKALFQSSEQIAEQYKRGVMAVAAGFEWRMSQNISSMTTGPLGGTPLVNGSGSVTGTTLATKGWTSAAASRLKKGDVFTIANVNAVNPLTYQSVGDLQQFVVTADFSSDGSGNGNVSIFPGIVTSGSTQTVDAAPIDGAAITMLASAAGGTVTPLNLAYAKDAFMFGCADLEMPKNVDMSSYAKDEDSGLSIRFVRYYDGNEDRLISRLDILYGWLAANPQWACRVQG